jgi:Family of unknown function (DUF6236)
MPDSIGLYYPHSALPNDAWVKLAALYWDKLGRIVPPGYKLQDSDTVQRLQGELGFVENFLPSPRDTFEVGQLFYRFLRQYEDKMKHHYNVLSQTSELEYIYSDVKMAHEFSRMLLDMGLAVHKQPDRGAEGTQVGMHPKLAFVYMEALVEHMALTRRLLPVTDNVRDHVVIGGYTLERLAQALLLEVPAFSERDDTQSPYVKAIPTADEVSKQMASIALQSVLPQNITSIPTEKIIRLRKEHRTELTAFQTHIHEFVAKLDTIQQIDDPIAIKAHLEAAYEREIKPQLDDLKKCMNSLAIETVIGILNIKVELPPFIASAGAALHLAPVSPIVAGASAIACSVIPVFLKKRTETQEKVRSSPTAYLLYVQEGLTTTNVMSQVTQTTRHMLFGA